MQLVDLSHAQDVEAGDGTTTVTVLAGSLLNACQTLLDKNVHPTIIANSFYKASQFVSSEICSGRYEEYHVLIFLIRLSTL